MNTTPMRVLQWPDTYPKNYDVNDLHVSGQGDVIKQMFKNAPEYEFKTEHRVNSTKNIGDQDLPGIQVNNSSLSFMRLRAWEAVMEYIKKNPDSPLKLYQTPQGLARIEHGRTKILSTHDMIHTLSHVAWFFTVDRYGNLNEVPPPKNLAEDVMVDIDPPIERLVSINPVPVFSKNGKLNINPGYDSESASFLNPPPGFKMSNVPDEANGNGH